MLEAFENHNRIIIKLTELNALLDRARGLMEDVENEDDWHYIYHRIFSEEISDEIFLILRELNAPTDYHDPDASYREDIEAFLQFVQTSFEEILNGLG